MIPTDSLRTGAMLSGMIMVTKDVYIIAMSSKGTGRIGDTSLHSWIAHTSLRKRNKKTSGRAFFVRWPDDP